MYKERLIFNRVVADRKYGLLFFSVALTYHGYVWLPVEECDNGFVNYPLILLAGFAFVGFDDEEVVRNLIRLHYLNIDGKQVEVKAMEPPISQRVGYASFPGGPLPQANGRAVRGGRSNHFTQVQPNDSCE
ncbi:hypothetical protein AHF37_12116 [Paragonimus kellicotti]|nr:hypothetical protein AHF37_12116 [Paragonimus kellicotti]